MPLSRSSVEFQRMGGKLDWFQRNGACPTGRGLGTTQSDRASHFQLRPPDIPSEALVDINTHDHAIELCRGLVPALLQVLKLAANRRQPVFLGVQLSGIALNQRLFLGSALERFHVLANAALVGGDAVRL